MQARNSNKTCNAPSICPRWIISLVVWCVFYCFAYILCEGWWRAPTAKVPGSCWGCAVWHIWSPWRIKTSLPLWSEWSAAIDRSSVHQRFFYQEVFSTLGRSHWSRQVKLTGKEDQRKHKQNQNYDYCCQYLKRKGSYGLLACLIHHWYLLLLTCWTKQ